MASISYENNAVLWQLREAILCRDIRNIRDILQNNSDIDSDQIDDNKLLLQVFHCVRDKLNEQVSIIEVLRLFLNFGADVNVKNDKGRTVLHLAIKSRMTRVIDFLISHKADLDVLDKSGNSILYLIVKKEAESIESLEFMQWIILKGFDVSCQNENEDTALHLALKKRKLDFAKIILKHSENIDVRNEDGNTPLNILMNYGEDSSYEFRKTEEKLVRTLLIKGANIHKLNEDGISPLINAVMNRSLNMLRIFRDRGIDFCHCYSGGSLLHYFFKSIIPKDIKIDEAVFNLLIDEGCDVNIKDDKGMTPLHFAARRTDPKIVKRLTKHGANVNSREFVCGYTPLHEAIEFNQEKMVVMLIEKGADVNSRTNKGRNALHLVKGKRAAKHVIPILIGHGAHIDVRDNDCFLPLQAAILRRDDNVMKELLGYGADINDNTHVLGFSDYKRSSKKIRKHLIKLQIGELPVDDKLRGLFTSYRNFAEIYEDCVIEVEKLKSYEITQSTSLYDLLRINDNVMCRYVKNVKLKKLVESSELKKKFPMYHLLITSRYYMAVERRKMLEPARYAWLKLTDIRLPDLCIYEILSNLGNVHLRIMIGESR